MWDNKPICFWKCIKEIIVDLWSCCKVLCVIRKRKKDKTKKKKKDRKTLETSLQGFRAWKKKRPRFVYDDNVIAAKLRQN